MNAMKRCTSYLLLLALLFNSGCTHSRNLQSEPIVSDGEYAGFMLLDDGIWFEESDGERFVRVSLIEYDPYLYTTDEVLNREVGSTFVYDSVLQFTVDRIEVDDSWKDPHQSTADYTNPDVVYNRLDGKITLSDDYYFIHPSFNYLYDGSIDVGVEKAQKWILVSDSHMDGYYPLSPAKELKLSSSLTQYRDLGVYASSKYHDIASMQEYIVTTEASNADMVYCNFFVSDGVITEININTQQYY